MKTGMFARTFLAAAVAFGTPLAVHAQQDASEMTAEQLEALFESQKTRGLVLAPVAGEEQAAAETETETEGTAVAAADPTYVQIDPSQQVNIRVEFAYDSAALADSEKAKLVTLCQVMLESDVPVFRIIGHTDAAGSDSYNQNLSLLRAQEVERYLVTDCGMPEDRLEAIGVGEAFPLDPNDPRSDVNRRVEFQVGA